MKTTELIRSVATTAGIEMEESEAMIDATLRTIAERINSDEARDLAAQLPSEITRGLVETAEQSPEGERFDSEEFVERVARRVGTGPSESEDAVRAVFATLSTAVEGGEWADVLAQLPNDMDALAVGELPSEHTG